MFLNNKVLAIIPARAGSKGIKDKNITMINGRPLIDYTIQEALKSSYLDRVILSTDSTNIADIANKCGCEVPFLRDKNLATDESRVIDVVLNSLENIDNLYDYVMVLQPTQPLRKVSHIDESIEMIINSKEESLASVSKVKDHPLMIREIDSKTNKLTKLLPYNSTVRRQEFPEYYRVNGAIYINRISDLHRNTSLNDNTLGYIVPIEFDCDIDEPHDLEVLKSKLK